MPRIRVQKTPLDILKRRMLAARSRPGVIRAILSEYRAQVLVDMANWQPRQGTMAAFSC
jgi:hypothetical protein